MVGMLSLLFWLSSQKKMECDSGASRMSCPGTALSPEKTPNSPLGIVSPPESDCNSNNLTLNNDILTCGTEKVQDCHDIFHDNSEYQWFLDYGYKESTQHCQSVFSALNTNNVSYYDDLARNFDANLAEVDMDDFHREDIHSVLSALPNMCNSDVQGIEEREMFASVSESLMTKFGLDFTNPHFISEEENVNSMCKSEPLFSPVQESYVPNANLSVDSLDLSENEVDLLITCQANKNNYTIAFEGSTVMGSDESVCPDTVENSGDREIFPSVKKSHNVKSVSSNTNNSMVHSDFGYTTWSKIKENSREHMQLSRRYSGNNNPHASPKGDNSTSRSSNAVKSLSLPNLFRQKQRRQPVGMSVNGTPLFDSSVEEDNQLFMKLYDIQKSNNSDSYDSSDSCNGDSQNRPHNLNLVKLFIKQKSASHEGMSKFVTERQSCNCFSEVPKVSPNTVSFEERTKKECFCQSDINENTNIMSLRNAWTQKNKNTCECSVSGFEDSLVSKTTNRNEKVQEKENSNSKSVDQVTECEISESNSTSDNLKLYSNELSSHKFHQSVEKRSTFTSMNNNNTTLENHKNKYYSDESTQENGSNTESTEYMMKCNKTQQIKSKVDVMEKSVQTSKLLEGGGNPGVNEVKVPAYILYPNYSLPDLEFLKEKHYVQNIDFTKIFLRPQTFKEPENLKQYSRLKNKASGKRPFSVSDIETLKRTGFKHVRDWDSLTFLLPKEYKQFLQEIPEIMTQLKDMKNVKEEFKPIFCLNGPSRKNKIRPMSCDSNIFMTDCRNSNVSSTGTQPSSGYRGSSTMLNSNFSNPTTSPRNPSRGFKYDSNEGGTTPPRNGLSLNSDDQSHRPPLPRSILRNHSLDNTRYTCKTQKENANKRYSMIELSEKNVEVNNSKSTKKSTQDPYHPSSPSKNLKHSSEVQTSGQDFVKNNSQCDNARFEENYLGFKGSNLEGDMRRLEELLEISAAFGESIESVSENDMLKLRSQVSKFLTMQKNLQKVSDRLQNVDEKKTSTSTCNENSNDLYKEKSVEDIKHSQTPNNTPEHKKKTAFTYDITSESDTDILSPQNCDKGHTDQCLESQQNEIFMKDDNLNGLKKTVSFAEKIHLTKNIELKSKGLPKTHSAGVTLHQALHKTYQGKTIKLVQAPICEESLEESLIHSPEKNVKSNYSLLHKKDLILDVKRAVEKIILRSRVNDLTLQEELSNICLHHLCPSLYAVLSDGLKEEMDTPFGPIRNSVWSVIVSSSQQGPLTENLNHLVQRLNRDPVLNEGLVKFNAFIFGLLNVKSLDSWFSYIRTRDELLHKYYDSRGLLLLSNSAGAPVRVLMDQLIQTIKSLAKIKFNLDLMYQAKLLHCSLQNLSSLLEVTQVNDLLSPTKHLMLLKLVQSIQNSINQPCDERRVRNSSDDVEKLSYDSVIAESYDKSSLPKHKTASKPRPRSGCEILNPDEVSDVASCAKKRWSGVQLNSKLLKAFERLSEEIESDYSDSLVQNENRKRTQESSKKSEKEENSDNDDTIDEIPATWNNLDSSENETKEQKKCILSHLNKMNSNKTDITTEIENIETSDLQNRNGGYKFRRLQQKWEKLSGKTSTRESCSSEENSPLQGINPDKTPKHTLPKLTHTTEKTYSETNLPFNNPGLRTSRIPRPVTSPVQMMSTPERQNGAVKKLTSPIVSSSSSCQHRGNEKWIPNTVIQKKNDVKSRNYATGRVSRVDEMSDVNSAMNAAKGRAIRPSSLPYKRGSASLPSRKLVPARASSMSLNRRPDKNSQPSSRAVRTLSHRLPSDSGHLSFNEGEMLKVVLEVDEIWLLCCRGSQKGLVPKSCVIPVAEHIQY